MRSCVAQGIARGVGAACFLVLPVLLLGSWMTQAQAATSGGPSLAEARAALFAHVDDAQQIAGGSWQSQDDPDSRGCTLPDGTSGRAYSVLRIASDPSATAIPLLTGEWTGLGYEVERAEIGPVTQLIATSADGELLIFRASDRAMTLQGESECRPAS